MSLLPDTDTRTSGRVGTGADTGIEDARYVSAARELDRGARSTQIGTYSALRAIPCSWVLAEGSVCAATTSPAC